MFGKVEDKANEVADTVEEAFGKATDAPEHQVCGAVRKYASQASYTARGVTESVKTQVESNVDWRSHCRSGRHRVRLPLRTQIALSYLNITDS